MARHETRHIKQVVGANLKAAREAADMTQREVGLAIDTDTSTIQRWERGKVEPGPVYRQELAALFFDGDVSALYRTPDEDPVPA